MNNNLLTRVFKNTSRIIRGGIAVSIVNVSTALVSLVLIPIMVRILGVREYGVQMLLQTVVSIAFTCSSVQYWQGVLLECSGGRSSKGQIKTLCINGFVFELAGIIITLIVVYVVFASGLFRATEMNLHAVTILSLSYVVPLLGSPLVYLRIFDKYGIIGYVGVASNVFKLILVFITGMAGGSLLGLAYALLVPELCKLLAIGIYIYYDSRNADPGMAVNKMTGILKVGISSTGLAMLDLPITQVDKAIIGILLSAELLAVYSILKRLQGLANILSAPYYANMIPIFSAAIKCGQMNEVRSKFLKMTMVVFVMTLALSICIIMGYYLLPNDFIPELKRYGLAMVFQMIIGVLAGTMVILNSLFWSLGKRKEILLITIASMVTYVFTAFVATGRLGLYGIQIALFLQLAFVGVLKLYKMRELVLR